MREVKIGNRLVGDGHPCFIISEIGINHGGSLSTALEMIHAAYEAGADACKFQKRDPEECVPTEQRGVMRDTPWGRMSYLDYRYHVELSGADYRIIDEHCKSLGIMWFSSAWDVNSVDFLLGKPWGVFDSPIIKVPSAVITDFSVLERIWYWQQEDPDLAVIMSTGGSTIEQIKTAVMTFPWKNLVLMHCVSQYPCPNELLNLKMIDTYRHMGALEKIPIGYSGHEVGLATTLGAVALGAAVVERHFTLDRAAWGSDQAASVEPGGFARLVKDIRAVESALGDGKKVITPGEIKTMEKLRRVQ